jgi:hypothetical protein
VKRSGRGDETKLLMRVFERLDWEALEDVYLHGGAPNERSPKFWEEHRPTAIELGDALARRLLRELPRGGASLWVGAGVAEVPVLLAEVMLHGREVVATNLRARECEVLNAALLTEAPDLPVRFVAEDARTVAAGRTFDHVGCISVFTDPETWPLLSDVAYGRIAPVQIDIELFAAERERARALAAGLFARLQRPGIVTTTAEEVAWFLEQARAAGATVDASEDLVETAIVGDPVGFLTIA